MHHLVFLNPRRAGRTASARRMPTRGASGRFLKRGTFRRKAVRSNPSVFTSRPTSTPTMARKSSRRRRSSARRIRRNPPAMTPARRAKIGRAIRAAYKAGKYRKVRRSSSRRRVATGGISRPARRSGSRRRSSFRRSAARRSSGGAFRMGTIGGGMLGLRALVSPDNLKLAGGAIAGTFVVNFTASKVLPMLPASMSGNPFVVAAVKLGTAAVVAKVASRWSRPVAQGILLGGMVVVANDFIRLYFSTGATAAATSQYLGRGQGGRGMAQYLGATPGVNRNVRSLVGAVTPTQRTFGGGTGLRALYGNTSAFTSDAWSRGR